MPDVQGILNETAKIVAGASAESSPGAYRGTGTAITAGGRAVKVAYSRLPEPTSLGEDGLVHVGWWDGFEVDVEGEAAGDLTTFLHRVRMQLMIALKRSDLPLAIGLLTPFVDAYVDTFAAKLGLNGKAKWSKLKSSPGIVDAIYPDRIAVEFLLLVKEKEALAYAV